MQRRDLLQRSSLGLLGAVPTQLGKANAPDVIKASDFGAVGDGIADDTAALQRAIDAAIAQGKSCFISSGTFKTTAPLRVGSGHPQKNFQAFRLFGTGKAAPRDAGRGGTNIMLSTHSQDAVLVMEKNAWRRCEVRDIGLECATLDGASAGILFDSTEYSNHLIDNVSVYRAKIAFAIHRGTGANGEFIMFNNCGAWDVDEFFYTNTGQAYVQYFNHCECALRPGGTYFHFDLASGGGGINVVDFNASGEPSKDGITNTTLVKNSNGNSCLNFLGGRIELLTQLYECIGGSPNLHVTASLTGLQVTVDYDRSNSALSKAAFLNIELAPDIFTVKSCTFEAVSGREAIDIRTRNSYAYVLFSGCDFERFSRVPAITSDFNENLSQVSFEDCRASVPISGPEQSVRPVPFDRHSHHIIGAIGRRKAFSENGWVHSGKPVNLLVKPQFTSLNGSGIRAEPPWQLYGQAPHFDAFGWDDAERRTRLSSPWAKLIALAPHSGIFQDITAVDLSAPHAALSFRGERLHVVCYQAMITQVGSGASLRFALGNSANDTIFDEARFTTASDGADVPRLVTLTATVSPQAEPAYVRLRIENTSSRPATVEFAWQMVMNGYDGAFAASDFAPVSYSDEWGLSSESGRFWHRLALPYKTDAFGSASRSPLADLQSDIYLSKSTERLTFTANSRWWTVPRSVSGSSVPVTGRWAQGDLVYDAAPKPGKALGWVQITPGQHVAETAWVPATAFAAGVRIYHGDYVYECLEGGVSAAAGGPEPREERSVDGTCLWGYLGPLASVACATAWAPGAHAVGVQVHNHGLVYECLRGGATDDERGPSGTTSSIPVGTTLWRYIGPLAVFKAFGLIEM